MQWLSQEKRDFAASKKVASRIPRVSQKVSCIFAELQLSCSSWHQSGFCQVASCKYIQDSSSMLRKSLHYAMSLKCRTLIGWESRDRGYADLIEARQRTLGSMDLAAQAWPVLVVLLPWFVRGLSHTFWQCPGCLSIESLWFSMVQR